MTHTTAVDAAAFADEARTAELMQSVIDEARAARLLLAAEYEAKALALRAEIAASL